MISKIPRRKAIPTCWSTNGASIKEFRVRNKGQCAPLTRSLSACTHFKKFEMPPRMGNFPTDSGSEDCGPQAATAPAKAKIYRGRKGKEARAQRDALPVTGSVEHLEMFSSSQYQQTNARERARTRLQSTFTMFAGVSPQSGRRFVRLSTILVQQAPCHVWLHRQRKEESSSRRLPKVPEVISARFNTSRECGAAGETTDPPAAC